MSAYVLFERDGYGLIKQGNRTYTIEIKVRLVDDLDTEKGIHLRNPTAKEIKNAIVNASYSGNVVYIHGEIQDEKPNA